MPHTKNLAVSLLKTEVDAKHLGAGFIKVVIDENGDFVYERLNPVLVLVKEAQ